MMVRIGVGLMPRTLNALPQQSAQGLSLVVASDDVTQQVNATGIVIEVAAPSAHAGSYPVSLGDLARGPICLVIPQIDNDQGSLTIRPGLWAYDPARGTVTMTRQWLIDGVAAAGETGLGFRPAASSAERRITVTETMMQSGIQTVALSKTLTLSATIPVEATGLSVSGDARMALVTAPDATVKVQVVEPAAYAGSYNIPAAQLRQGPLWLVPASIEGTDKVGGQLSVICRGLPVGDAAAGPIGVQGQWQRNGAPIANARANTYQVQSADLNCRIAFLETATDSNGTRQQLSNEIIIGGAL